jgi:hypothetical protein
VLAPVAVQEEVHRNNSLAECIRAFAVSIGLAFVRSGFYD